MLSVSHGDLHRTAHGDETGLPVCTAAALSFLLCCPSSTLGTLPCFLWGGDGLFLYLRGIHYPNQQLLGSKQPGNLGWPWPWRSPPVPGNTVIWAEAVFWALPTGQNYSGLSSLLAKAPGGLRPLEVGWHRLLRAALWTQELASGRHGPPA